MKKSVTEHPLKAMRRAGVPLVGFESNDPAETIKSCRAALNGKGEEIALFQWDCASGWQGLNDLAKDNLAGWYDPLSQQFPETLKLLGQNAPPGSVAFVLNPQRFWEMPGFAQAIWNLRDTFKGKGPACQLVLVGPSLKLPPELASDVVLVEEEAPTPADIERITSRIVTDARKAPGGEAFAVDVPKVVAAAQGLLSGFDVEQTIALCASRSGINPEQVWQRKIQRLKAATGAEITINNPTFEAVAGCANSKSEIEGFIGGRQRPGVVVFLDEIEKLFAGAGTDLSGVSTNLVGQFLTWTAERKARGFLLAGIPGSGKTWTGTCAAGQAGIPFLKIQDIKGSLVGESDAKLRSALKAADALAGDGSILLIASCNWVDTLTPDLMARFTMGTFFYDFPSDDELAALWAMYRSKFDLPDQPLPKSQGWVGREVETCCWRSWQYNRPLVEVAKNIVPSCVSQKAKLEQLRQSCSGRFLSASVPGVFRATAAVKAETAGRSMDF